MKSHFSGRWKAGWNYKTGSRWLFRFQEMRKKWINTSLILKVEQIKKMVSRGDYGTAMKIADTIDWHRVRNASLLSMIAQIYEKK